MPDSPDRENLLSAVLAIQLGLVSLRDVLAALQEIDSSGQSLAKQLHDRGSLTSVQERLLANIIEVHRAAHGGDVERSLMALEVNESAASIVGELTPQGDDVTVDFNRQVDPPTQISDPRVKATASGERYRKLLAHAKGGLGEVSVARDDQLKREVALKELQEKHADDPAKKQRFLLEGEVTGALEHPGIVPVYSLGFDARARPFYAMRFIRGSTLHEAIQLYHDSTDQRILFDRGSLKLRRLITRLVDVCNAIEYAHSRGVLHRDIKPSNIMLGKYGETYVVDWGMARVLHAEERIPESQSEGPLLSTDLSGSSETQMGSAMGTPAFMSPEQAAGALDRVGVRSDVYSLGATLYAMLCNRPPFDRDDLVSILRKVQEGEFEKPSLRKPRVPKKLEAICLKAMALEPGDRYASAAAFGQDLESWLGDEPILASPDTWTERTFRFVRRHRTWALAGGTAVILIAVTASVAALLIDRARSRAEHLAEENAQLAVAESRSREQAEQRFTEARETVDTWLTGFSEALQNYPGVSGFRRHMLERAVKDYERFAAELSEDSLQNEGVQIERGRTLIRLGDLQRRLSQPDKAADSYRRAIEALTGSLERATSPKDQRTITLAIAKAHGRLALAAIDRADTPLARESFEQALKLLDPLTEAKQLDSKVVTLESSLRINFGQLLLSQNQLNEAERHFIAAIKQLETAVHRRTDELLLQVNLAAAKIGWGQTQLLRGDALTAKKHFTAALAVYRAISDLSPDEPKYLEQQAMASLYLASAERRLGDMENEAKSYQHAIEDYARLNKALPDAIVYQENLALTQTDLGQLQLEMNDTRQALSTLRNAKRTLLSLTQSYPTVPRFYEEHAIAHDNLAQVLITLGKYQEALGESEAAVGTFERLTKAYPEIPAYRERLAVAESHLAQIWAHLEEYDAAEQKISTAVQRLEGLLTTSEHVVSHRYFLALIQSIQGDIYWQQQKEAALTAYENSSKHWKDLKEVTQDPVYLNAAAWFFTSCPELEFQDTAVALAAAELATKAAPGNERFRDTKALVYFYQERYADCLQLLGVKTGQLSLPHGRSMLIAAMSAHSLGKETEAKSFFENANAWIKSHQPGNWQLAILKRECQRVIEAKEGL